MLAGSPRASPVPSESFLLSTPLVAAHRVAQPWAPMRLEAGPAQLDFGQPAAGQEKGGTRPVPAQLVWAGLVPPSPLGVSGS